MNLKEFLEKELESFQPASERVIDKDTVVNTTRKAAESIFGKVDETKLKRTVATAIKKAEDTEDAIQIAINMMRG